MSVVAGVDFGTQSVRVSLFDGERGRLGSGTGDYPVHRRAGDPDHASQSHADHMRALVEAMGRAIAAAGIDGRTVEALAIDTTGSTVVPVGEGLEPLDDYYLWCDHRAWREADQITRAAQESGLDALRWSGGTFLAEFGLSKLFHWLRTRPEQRPRFVTALEHCDLVAAVLCGITDPAEVPRSICAMGHKWMWVESRGGLPPEDFLAGLDPALAGVRDRIAGRFARSDSLAGTLCGVWADRLGLRAGIPIPVGSLDAHWDAIGAGIGLGDVVNVIGTSTCVMAISESDEPIPGVCGVVPGSIHPSYAGIEAGLSAAGDLFESIARRAGASLADLSRAIAGYRSGQTGLLRLVWDHGDRTILGDPHLRGAAFGWGLAHTAADELFAAMEGTAYQTRIILERMAEHGVPVRRVINAGGIPRKGEVINRVYANVLGAPVLVPEQDTTSLGSAIFAFLAAGTFRTVEEAQQALCPSYRTYEPDPAGSAACERLYAWYRSLYTAMGREDSEPVSLGALLPALRREAAAAASLG
ncbi:ribulokinase [Tundrisphaera sp. TA3]|uniref:ribulokinase n=1 Tax=Tundrisphaera sp. TA3 TaxID=3435775 RepID=UPI003EBC5DAA